MVSLFILKPIGNIIFSIDSHPENAVLSNIFKVEGNFMLVRFLQSLKALSLIIINPSGKSMLFNSTHPEKADSPILFKVVGRLT